MRVEPGERQLDFARRAHHRALGLHPRRRPHGRPLAAAHRHSRVVTFEPGEFRKRFRNWFIHSTSCLKHREWGIGQKDRETRGQGDKGTGNSLSPCLPLSLSPCLSAPFPTPYYLLAMI